MKKIVSLMLVVLIAVFACGCGADTSTPKDTVTAFMEAMKELDAEAIAKVVDTDQTAEEFEEKLNGTEEDSLSVTKAFMGRIEYTICEIEETSTSAFVMVEVKTVNLMALAAMSLSEEDTDKMVEAIESAELGEAKEIKIRLTKVEDEWLVEDDSAAAFTMTIMGGFLGA